MLKKPVNPSFWAQECVSDEGQLSTPSSAPTISILLPALTEFYLLSFAYVEMSLILAKIFFKFDLELINKNLDWEGESQGHILWWKPKLYVRFIGRNGA